jgi:hypothetical protein
MTSGDVRRDGRYDSDQETEFAVTSDFVGVSDASVGDDVSCFRLWTICSACDQ